MNVLSLFDGGSFGKVALERANIKVEKYISSEIKKNAIKVSKANHKNIIRVGDITKLSYKNNILFSEFGEFNIGKIDMIIGGSPCQDFSRAKNFDYNNEDKYGLNGNKSSLFYEFLRLLNEVKPKYFLLENVRMKKESRKELDEYLGVKGLDINSNLVSFQNRPRIYWTNIPNVEKPKDKNINFQDFKDKDYEYCKKFKVNKTPSRIKMWNNGKGKTDIKSCPNITNAQKIGCLTRKQDRAPNSGLIEFDNFCRFLTTREQELAQTAPVGYCDCLSKNQAQDILGDGWTVDVIAHIFSFLPEEYKI